MPRKRTKKITGAEQDQAIAELEAKTREVADIVGKLAFYQNEAIAYKMLRDVDYYDGKTLAVGVTYVAPTDEAFEVRIANELHTRLERTVNEWAEWVQEELRPDDKVPF